MEKMITTVKEKKVTKKSLKARLYILAEKMLRHNAMLAVWVIVAGICMAGAPQGSTIFDQTTVYAEDKTKDKTDETSADATWNKTTEWMSKWVMRLGGVIAFLGLLEVGQGFFQDNPSAKTFGWKLIVGGGIVAAAGKGYDTFMA